MVQIDPDTEALYLKYCEMADELLLEHDPCGFDAKWQCAGNRDPDSGYYSMSDGCCVNSKGKMCEHLLWTKKCTVKSLWCKTYLCDTIRNSKQFEALIIKMVALIEHVKETIGEKFLNYKVMWY